MITISVNDEFSFINNVDDYIVESGGSMRFQSSFNKNNNNDDNNRHKSLAYYLTKNNAILEYFDCPLFDKGLHTHNIEQGKSFANDTVTSTRCFRGHFYKNNPIVFCTSMELVVVEYINQQLTLVPEIKQNLISTLHEWLPSCTFDCVKLNMFGGGSGSSSSSKPLQIHSYFEPTFITARYNIDIAARKKSTTLDYYYYETSNYIEHYNIVYPEKNVHTCGDTRINCYRISQQQ